MSAHQPDRQPDHSTDELINAAPDYSIDAGRTVATQSWLDAPNFDDAVTDEWAVIDEWAAIDDHDRLLVDGHLSDLGVSVVADIQGGVVDAAEGLDPQAVQSSIMHLARCSDCPARVASVAGWARAIALDGIVDVATPALLIAEADSTATPHIAPAGTSAEPQHIGTGHTAATHASTPVDPSSSTPDHHNVISIDTKRRRFVSPRGIASVAAAVAACAFAATTLLNSSPKVASTDLALAETTVVAAAADAAPVAPETAAAAAAETTAALNPTDEAAAAAGVARATETAPPNTAGLENDVVSFETEAGATSGSISSSGSAEPVPPPAARKSSPSGAFPTTTLFQSGSGPTTPADAKVIKEARVNSTSPPKTTPSAAGAVAAAPAPPSTVASGFTTVLPNTQGATPNQDSVARPALLPGSFLTVQDVQTKLIAEPSLASPDTEGPCGKELRSWLIAAGADQAAPRFVRAQVADRVLTFAIATAVQKQAVVVVADEACRQIN